MKDFFSSVYPEPNTGCWLWAGWHTKFGYGMVRKDQANGFNMAHRYSYFLHYGDFDRSLCVLHKCDNAACVNPEHLWLGTYLDNNSDRARKGRSRSHKGEASYLSKLKEPQVREIWGMAKSGLGATKISRITGVGREAVNGIIHKRNWKHLNLS